MANIVQHKRSSSAGSTPTTSDLAVGEIGINTADAKMFTNNGSAVVELGGIQNLSEDTTPSLGGDLTIDGHNITLGDSDSISLGDSAPLTLSRYTSFGTYNWIRSQATGAPGLLITTEGSCSIRKTSFFGETIAEFHADSYCQLWNDNVARLKTTSIGVDIFGTLTATGVDVTDSNSIGRFGGDGSTGGVTLANGYVDIRGKSVSEATYINFYCESSNAHAVKLQAPAHADFSGNITATLPNVTGTLVTSNAQKRIEVVSALPGSPDANTIYFVT